MSNRKVIIPCFKHHQVNDPKHDGNLLTPEQVFVRNMEAMYNAADTAFTSPTDNAIYLFVREKMDNGEFKYGCAAIPTEYDEYIAVEFPGFKKLPPVFLNTKEEIVEVVKRIKSNLMFI